MKPRAPAAAATSLIGLVTGPVSARRWWVRALVRVTGGSLGLLVLVLLVVAYLVTLRPDVPAARRLARNQLLVMLEAGEQVNGAAWARRREWWDGFRETYGILALTDRRLLFVGIPPRELVTPERGPQQFVVMQVTRDASLRAQRERVDLGTATGLRLMNDRVSYAFASDDAAGMDSVLADVTRGARSDASTVELARREREYEEEVARRAVWHVVAAGDALESVASRYGTTEEQIATLNRLSGTTIKIGQRLLVKPAR